MRGRGAELDAKESAGAAKLVGEVIGRPGLERPDVRGRLRNDAHAHRRLAVGTRDVAQILGGELEPARPSVAAIADRPAIAPATRGRRRRSPARGCAPRRPRSPRSAPPVSSASGCPRRRRSSSRSRSPAWCSAPSTATATASVSSAKAWSTAASGRHGPHLVGAPSARARPPTRAICSGSAVTGPCRRRRA